MKNLNTPTMLKRIINFYYEGFSNMRIGKTLWVVVLVKLAVIFVILRIFFMPDILSERAGDGNEADYVSSQITGRAPGGQTAGDNGTKTLTP